MNVEIKLPTLYGATNDVEKLQDNFLSLQIWYYVDADIVGQPVTAQRVLKDIIASVFQSLVSPMYSPNLRLEHHVQPRLKWRRTLTAAKRDELAQRGVNPIQVLPGRGAVCMSQMVAGNVTVLDLIAFVSVVEHLAEWLHRYPERLEQFSGDGRLADDVVHEMMMHMVFEILTEAFNELRSQRLIAHETSTRVNCWLTNRSNVIELRITDLSARIFYTENGLVIEHNKYARQMIQQNYGDDFVYSELAV